MLPIVYCKRGLEGCFTEDFGVYHEGLQGELRAAVGASRLP